MDVEITDMNEKSFLLSDYDVHVQDFNVGSIPIEGKYNQIEGSNRKINYGTELGQRVISVPFYIEASDMADYPLLRDKLFGLTVTREPIYLRELRRANEVTSLQTDEGDDFVGGKRYKVRVSGDFELDQNRHYGFGEIEFETVGSPFAESIGTTKDIESRGLLYNDGIWSYGMGLEYEREAQKYTHQRLEFAVYNAGNVGIHPFEQNLTIMLRNIGKGYTLINETTGDKFEYKGRVTGDFKLEGPNMTMKGLQAFRDTNRRYITLAPGWNHFNQNKAKITEWDFKFYYK